MSRAIYPIAWHTAQSNEQAIVGLSNYVYGGGGGGGDGSVNPLNRVIYGDEESINIDSLNVTIKGNMEVDGDTSSVFYISNVSTDMKLHLGTTGPAGGLIINRADDCNYGIVYDDSDKKFKVGFEGALESVALEKDMLYLSNNLHTNGDINGDL